MTTRTTRTTLLALILGGSCLLAPDRVGALDCEKDQDGAFAGGDWNGAFKSGDLTGDELIDMRDVISLVETLYWKAIGPPCLPAADLNADEVVDEKDVVVLLTHVFLQSPLPKLAHRISEEEITEKDLAEIRMLAEKAGLDLDEVEIDSWRESGYQFIDLPSFIETEQLPGEAALSVADLLRYSVLGDFRPEFRPFLPMPDLIIERVERVGPVRVATSGLSFSHIRVPVEVFVGNRGNVDAAGQVTVRAYRVVDGEKVWIPFNLTGSPHTWEFLNVLDVPRGGTRTTSGYLRFPASELNQAVHIHFVVDFPDAMDEFSLRYGRIQELSETNNSRETDLLLVPGA